MKKIFFLSLIITIVLRLPWIKIPFFISDEAVILTVGGQIVQEGAIYANGFMDSRGPGGYFLGALITFLAGYGNTVAFHLAGIGFQIVILLLIRQLGRQLFNEATANIACLFFAIFSYSYIFHDTLAFNVEFMALPFLLASAICFWAGQSLGESGLRQRLSFVQLFAAGFFCAATFAIKQVIAGCLAVYVCILLYRYLTNKNSLNRFILDTLSITVGFILGFLLLFGISLYAVGWSETIYWLALFAAKHRAHGILPKITLFTERIVLLYIALPVFSTLYFFWIANYLFSILKRSTYEKYGETFLFIMLLMQWVGIIIAGQVSGHNMIPTLPFLSIMAADIFLKFVEFIRRINDNLRDTAFKYALVALVFVGFLPPVLNYTLFPEGVQTEDYSVFSFLQEKLRHKNDALNQTIQFIQTNTSEGDKIFVLGLLYEVYPLSKRLPASVALGLNWFVEKDKDPLLNATYNTIISKLNENPPKVIVLPCWGYQGIDLIGGPWEEIRSLIKEKYQEPKRLSGKSKLRFLRGKKLMGNVEEWVDVYLLKTSTTSFASHSIDFSSKKEDD
jgi:hypothetical protein